MKSTILYGAMPKDGAGKAIFYFLFSIDIPFHFQTEINKLEVTLASRIMT